MAKEKYSYPWKGKQNVSLSDIINQKWQNYIEKSPEQYMLEDLNIDQNVINEYKKKIQEGLEKEQKETALLQGIQKTTEELAQEKKLTPIEQLTTYSLGADTVQRKSYSDAVAELKKLENKLQPIPDDILIPYLRNISYGITDTSTGLSKQDAEAVAISQAISGAAGSSFIADRLFGDIIHGLSKWFNFKSNATEEEKKQYELNKEVKRQYEAPVYDKMINARKEFLKEVEKGKVTSFTPYEYENYNSYDKPDDDNSNMWLAEYELTQQIEFLERARDGRLGFFNEFFDNWSNIVSLDVKNLYVNSRAMRAESRLRRGKYLTERDKAYFAIDALQTEIDNMGIFEHEHLARIGQSVSNSVGFMMGFGGATKGISTGLSSAANAMKSVKALGKILNTEKKLAQGLLSVGRGVLETGLVGAAMPMTYSEMSKRYVGNNQIMYNENGENPKIIATKEQKEQFQQYANSRLNTIENEIVILKNDLDNGKITEQKLIEEVAKKQQEVMYLSEIMGSIIDPDTGKPFERDETALGSFFYGYGEAIKEAVTERYVGEVLSKIPLMSGKTRLARRAAIGRERANKWMLGSLARHTGQPGVIHNFPVEVMEELAIQLMPSATTDNFLGTWKKNVAELANPTFYLDVIASTGLITGGIGAYGQVNHYRKMKTNEKYREGWDKRLQVYDAVYKAFDDLQTVADNKELNEIIASVALGASTSPKEYQEIITNLRAKGDKVSMNAADFFEQKGLLNLVNATIQTDSFSDFKKAFNYALKNRDLNAETRLNLQQMSSYVNQMGEAYNKYKDYVNFSEIMGLNHSLQVGKYVQDKLLGKIVDIAPNEILANEDISELLYNKKALTEEELEDIITEVEGYSERGLITNEQSKELISSLALFDMYNNTLFGNDKTLPKDQKSIQEQYDYATNPDNQEKIRKEILKTGEDNLIKNVTPANVNEIKKLFRKQKKLTPDIERRINESLKNYELNKGTIAAVRPLVDKIKSVISDKRLVISDKTEKKTEETLGTEGTLETKENKIEEDKNLKDGKEIKENKTEEDKTVETVGGETEENKNLKNIKDNKETKETKTEETKTEEGKVEEVKDEGTKTEEVKTEEAKVEESKTDEVKAEEIKAEEKRVIKPKKKKRGEKEEKFIDPEHALFSPKVRKEVAGSEEGKRQIEQVAKNIIDEAASLEENGLGHGHINFKTVMRGMASSYGHIFAANHFEMMKQAWKLAEKELIKQGVFEKSTPEIQYEHVLAELLFPIEQILNNTGILDSTESIEDVALTPEQVEKIDAAAEVIHAEYEVQGLRTAHPYSKLPFAGLNYEYYYDDENKVIVIRNLETENVISAGSEVFLDWDVLPPGTKVKIAVSNYWKNPTNTMYSYVEVENEGIRGVKQESVSTREWIRKIFPDKTFEEVVATDINTLLENEEFRKSVPIDLITSNGEIHEGHGWHDYYWWNSLKVADSKDAAIQKYRKQIRFDPTRTNEEFKIAHPKAYEDAMIEAALNQEKIIRAGRENNLKIRDMLFKTSDLSMDMSVSNREFGTAIDYAKEDKESGKTLKSVKDANPTAQMAVVKRDGNLYSIGGQIINLGNGVLDNLEAVRSQKNIIGSVMMVCQVGTKAQDGKIVPVYHAYKCLTNQLQPEKAKLYETAKIIRAINLIENNQQLPVELAEYSYLKTDEYKGVRDKIISEFQKLGYNIRENADNVIRLFPEIAKGRKSGKLVDLKNPDGTDMLRYDLKVEGITKNTVIPVIKLDGQEVNVTTQNYLETVREQVMSHKRFIPIQRSNGETIYISDIQPRIEIVISDERLVISGQSREEKKNENDIKTDTKTDTKTDIKTDTKIDKKIDKKIDTNDIVGKVVETSERIVREGEENKKIEEGIKEDTIKNVEKELANTTRKVFTNVHKEIIVDNIFHEVLRTLNLSEGISLSEAYRAMVLVYEKTLAGFGDEYRDEHKFMNLNREALLGLTNRYYSGSIRQRLDEFFTVEKKQSDKIAKALSKHVRESKVQIDDITKDENELEENEDFENLNEILKGFGKQSFENDLTLSLSSKARIFFAGIPKRGKMVQQFGNLRQFYNIDMMMAGALEAFDHTTKNSIEDLKAVMQDKLMRTTPSLSYNEQTKQSERIHYSDYVYYEDMLERIETLEKIENGEAPNLHVLKQLQYLLFQNSVRMHFLMMGRNQGEYTIQEYNADNRSKDVVRLREFQDGFKTSDLIVNKGKVYQIKEKEAIKLEELYKMFMDNKKKTYNIKPEDVDFFFKQFGISLNIATIESLLNPAQFGNTTVSFVDMLNDSGLVYVLMTNLRMAEYKNGLSQELRFMNKESILLHDNNNNVKGIISYDNVFTMRTALSNYIAGKTINKYEQPKFITFQLKKLLGGDEKVWNQYMSSPFSRHSLVLQMMANGFKNFGISQTSLETLKMKGDKGRDDLQIDKLGMKDSIVATFGMFAHQGGKTSRTLYKIPVRVAKMPFPTLSDSGNMPLFQTVVFDITHNDIVKGEKSLELDERVIQAIFDQCVLPELERIYSHVKVYENLKSTNPNLTGVANMDIGSQLFGLIPSLNGVLVKSGNEKMTLIEALHEYSKKENKDADDFVDQFKEAIHNEIRRVIDGEVNDYIEINENGEVRGEFVKQNLFGNDSKQITENPVSSDVFVSSRDRSLQFVDSSYMRSKMGKGNPKSLSNAQIAKLAAYDYVVNSYINYANIAMLFSGDIANYYTKTASKSFVNNDVTNVLVNERISGYLAEYFYGQEGSPGNFDEVRELLDIYYNDIEGQKEESERILIEHYPKVIIPEATDIREVVGNLYIDLAEEVATNLSKRLKELISPGSILAESSGRKTFEIVMDDKISSSEVIDTLVKTHYPSKYNEATKKRIDKFQKLNAISENMLSENQKNELEGLMNRLKADFPDIAPYLETTSTDGQEYNTWQDQLDQLASQGKITSKMYDRLWKKLESQSKDGVNENNRLAGDELKVIMQPQKPRYVGLRYKPIATEGELEGNIPYSAQIMTFIKPSSFTLLPELTQGFAIDNLRKNAEEIQRRRPDANVRVTYKSAVKVGTPNVTVSSDMLFLDNLSEEQLKAVEASSIELEKEYFSIQQDKPFKSDKNIAKNKRDENVVASQFEKIILANGISQIKEKIFPNLFDEDLLADLGIEVENDKVSGKALYAIYNEIYKREQEILKNQLFDELGLNSYEDFDNTNVALYESLALILQSRLNDQQDIEGIELIYYVKQKDGSLKTYSKDELSENGLVADSVDFKFPIWMLPNSRKFESVFNSMISNNNVRLKIHGFGGIVASQNGFTKVGMEDYLVISDERLVISNEEVKKSLQNMGVVLTENFDGTLKSEHNEDGSLKYAQVLAPNKFRVIRNGKMEMIDIKDYVNPETGLLDYNKIPQELLQMFSFRIPTSSHQSGALIEIVGFVPKTEGDLLVVPKDSTVQMGEDYDIDVRYIYMLNYIEKEGKIQRLTKEDIPTTYAESIQAAKNNLLDFRQRLLNQFADNSTLWKQHGDKILSLALLEYELERYRKDFSSQDEIDEAEMAVENLKSDILGTEGDLVISDVVINDNVKRNRQIDLLAEIDRAVRDRQRYAEQRSKREKEVLDEVKGLEDKRDEELNALATALGEDIYNQLGNNTVNGNVVVENDALTKAKQNPLQDGKIYSTRVPNSNQHFGNPFALQEGWGAVKVDTMKEAVVSYIEWLTTDKYLDVNPEQRAWILEQLQSGSLVGLPVVYYKELGEASHANALDYLVNSYFGVNKGTLGTLETNGTNGTLGAGTNRVSYSGGYENVGKGTVQGDGKDKAMREVADGFIGEIVKKNSSSQTSRNYMIDKTNKADKSDKQPTVSVNSPTQIDKGGSVIMLARNSEFKNKPLTEETKYWIRNANLQGATFVVGDMPHVDSQFIEYLDEIGASYTIYHTGEKARIVISDERLVISGQSQERNAGTLGTVENGLRDNYQRQIEDIQNKYDREIKDVRDGLNTVRFQYSDTVSDEEIEEAKKWDYLVSDNWVAELTGEEFQKDEVPLTEKVTKFYKDNYNGQIEREEIGTILLDEKGVKSSMAHGLSKTKSSAFAAVPDIIQNGIIVREDTNWKNRKYDTAVITAPLKIGNEGYVGLVIVKKQSGTNRFYLHEVRLQKNLQDVSLSYQTVVSPLHRTQQLGDIQDVSKEGVLKPDTEAVHPNEDNTKIQQIFKRLKASSEKVKNLNQEDTNRYQSDNNRFRQVSDFEYSMLIDWLKETGLATDVIVDVEKALEYLKNYNKESTEESIIRFFHKREVQNPYAKLFINMYNGREYDINKFKTVDEFSKQVISDIENATNYEQYRITKVRDYEAQVEIIREQNPAFARQLIENREENEKKLLEYMNNNRQSVFDEWVKYTQRMDSFLRALILKSVTKFMTKNNERMPAPFDIDVVNEVVSEIENKNIQDSFNFYNIYSEKLRQKYAEKGDNEIVHDEKGNVIGKWIRIKGIQNDRDNFQSNVKQLKMLSFSSWCTSSYNAEPYLREGDFFVYVEQGKSQASLGIKLGGDYQGVYDEKNVQNKVNEKSLPILQQFVNSRNNSQDAAWNNVKKVVSGLENLKDGEERLRQKKQRLLENEDRIFEPEILRLFREVTGVDVQIWQIFFNEDTGESMGQNYWIHEISEGHKEVFDTDPALCRMLQTILNKVVEISDQFCCPNNLSSLGDINKVGGDFRLGDSRVNSLGNLIEIGGSANFNFSKLITLGGLRVVGGDVNTTSSQLTSLGELERIGGRLSLSDVKVQDLGELKEIGTSLLIQDCNIKNLGKLQRINDSLHIENSNVETFGELNWITQRLDIRNSKIGTFEKLKYVNQLIIDKSEIKTFGGLRYIRKLRLDNSEIGTLSDLEYINELDFNNSEIGSVGNLAYIFIDKSNDERFKPFKETHNNEAVFFADILYREIRGTEEEDLMYDPFYQYADDEGTLGTLRTDGTLGINEEDKKSKNFKGIKEKQEILKGLDILKKFFDGQEGLLGSVHNSEIGDINIYSGEAGSEQKDFRDGFGLEHIIARRWLEGNNVVETLFGINEVLARGKKVRDYGGEEGRIDLQYGDYIAVISKQKDLNREFWQLSGFKIKSDVERLSYIPNNYASNFSVSRKKMGADFNAKIQQKIESVEKDIRYMETPDGVVYGFVTKENVVYLDPNFMTYNTPIHEFGHLWNSFIYKNNKELWDKGSELIKDTVYWKKVNNHPNYIKLTDKQKVDEALAMAIGDRGESLLNSNKDKSFRDWLKDVWEWISQFMGIRDLSSDEISKLTFEEFINGAVADLLSKQKIVKQITLENQLKGKVNQIKNSLRGDEFNPHHLYLLHKRAEDLRKLVLENNLISMYKAVFGTGEAEINKLITSSLNTEFAGATADLIDKKLSEGKGEKKSRFTVLSYQHQKEMMNQGASGMLGISVHSNTLSIMGVIQQATMPIQLLNPATEEPIDIVFGNLRTNGLLTKTTAEVPKYKHITPRSIATINMENQNVSVDNLKLFIMSKRNENKHTINAFSTLSGVLGIDNDGIEIEGKQVSYASLFMSQPILRRYVELADYFNNYTVGLGYKANELIEKILIGEFGEDVEWYVDDLGKEHKGMMSFKALDKASTELTSQYLYDNLIDDTGNNQWAVYTKFKQLNQLSGVVNELQRFINIENGGIGKSFFDVLDKKNYLMYGLPTLNKSLTNATSLIGDYAYASDEDDIEDLESQGYILIGEDDYGMFTLIRPTTPQGQKIVNSVVLGEQLWKNIFPFESTFIKSQIDQVLFNSDIKEGTNRELEMKYKVLSEAKDYLYSSCVKSFKTSQQEDINLFMDSENNKSLASYLCYLRVQKHPLMSMDFFNMLEFSLEDGTEPSLIKLNATGLKKTDKSKMYNTLRQLHYSSEFLPDYNGKSYSYRELVKDLARYALLANQEGGAIGFRQYIPIEVLDYYGVTSVIKATAHVSAYTQHNLLYNSGGKALEMLLGSTVNADGIMVNRNRVSEGIMKSYVEKLNSQSGKEEFRIKGNDIEVLNKNNEKYVSNFVKQYFQHHPEDCTRINDRDLKTILQGKNVSQVKGFTSEKYDNKDFVHVRDKNREVHLFQNLGKGQFIKINKLGSFGINEYNCLNPKNLSVFGKNKDDMVMYGNSVIPIEVQPATEEGVIKRYTLSEALRTVSQANGKYATIANFFMKYYDPDVVVQFTDQMSADGAYISQDKTIYIHEAMLGSDDFMRNQTVLLHEYMHSLTKELINKYVNLTINEQGKLEVEYKTDDIPAGLAKLISVYRFAIDKVVEEQGVERFMEQVDKFEEDRQDAMNEIIYSRVDMEAYYVSNINEFVAGLFFNNDFRKKMQDTPYKATEKSLLRNFVEALLKMYNSLFKGEDNVTQHTVDALVELLETTHQVAKTPISITPQTVSADMLENDRNAESLIEQDYRVIDGNAVYKLMQDKGFPTGEVKFLFDENVVVEASGAKKILMPGYKDLGLYLYNQDETAYIVNSKTGQVMYKTNLVSDMQSIVEFFDMVNSKITSGIVEVFEDLLVEGYVENTDIPDFISRMDINNVEPCD